jgi:hypothetical protein
MTFDRFRKPPQPDNFVRHEGREHAKTADPNLHAICTTSRFQRYPTTPAYGPTARTSRSAYAGPPKMEAIADGRRHHPKANKIR